jgi:hypothetical protein
MNIVESIKKKFRKTITSEAFAATLWECFRRMRKRHIQILEQFSSSVKEMNEDELMKLEWELSIFDSFIITYCCRIHLNEEIVCNDILDIFHRYVYDGFSKIDKMLTYTFQEESKIKYKIFFDAIESDKSFRSIVKKLGANIYGETNFDAIEMNALRVYVEGNLNYINDIVNNIINQFDIKKS